MTKRKISTIPLKDRPHVLYEIVSTKTPKKYIGLTCDPKGRWSKHKTIARTDDEGWTIHNAMRKYGIDSFSFNEIQWYPNKALVAQAEIEAVATGNYAYNEAPGGLGGSGSGNRTPEGQRRILEAITKPRGPMPEWHKEAIRQGHLNNPRVVSQETRNKISEANRGRVRSEECIQKLRTLRVGTKLSPETIAKRSAKVKGMKKSPEVIANMKAGWVKRKQKAAEAKTVPSDLKEDE